MRYGKLPAVVLILALAANCNLALAAGQKEANLYWDELQTSALHEKIAIRLPDGTRVEGNVRAIHPDSLELGVQKTSNARLHSKGRMVIARSSLSSFELYSKRAHDSNTGIKAGASIGAVAGTLVGAAVARHNESRFYAIFVGSMFTGMALGKLIVNRTETQTVLIHIIPESPVSEPATTKETR